MLTLFCWIVYGQWPHQALTLETLTWAYPLAFILDLLWMGFCAWIDDRLAERRKDKQPWRYL